MDINELKKILEKAHKVNAVADLRFADLRSANLHFADLSFADLSFADLRSANLRSADLRFANLRSADLSSANLCFANLYSANLSSANLSSADLSFADLRSANLRSANLSFANLSFADLSSANLCFANLYSADLRSADLSQTKGLLKAREWVSKNFKKTKSGFIVYKRIGKTAYHTPEEWKINKSEFLEEVVNPLPTIDCGCGVNFGTLEWCLHNYTEANLWECLILFEDAPDIVVPYNTDGKARCGRLQLIKKIS